jgi:hypothetical protein
MVVRNDKAGGEKRRFYGGKGTIVCSLFVWYYIWVSPGKLAVTEMSRMLTKEDLRDIKGVVDEAIDTRVPVMLDVALAASEARLTKKIEESRTEARELVDNAVTDLSGVIADGLAMVSERFDEVDARFEQVDVRLEGMDRQLKVVGGQIKELQEDMTEVKQDLGVVKHMVRDHSFRVARLEHKNGLI